jgi:hypothetical protein
MPEGLTDVDTITLKYFMNSQYTVDGVGGTADETNVSIDPKQYKERIIRLFSDLVNETPTAETTDKLESIFQAFVAESLSMYRMIDAMPQQRDLSTIDTQDIAMHEVDKDLVKQIGTSGKKVMEEFVRYNSVSKLTEPPRITGADKISPNGRDTERNGKHGSDGNGKKKPIVKKKKKTGKNEASSSTDKKRGRKKKPGKEKATTHTET